MHKIITWGCFGFDREQEMLFISVCEAPIFIKSGKKINADDAFFAADAAIAA